MCLNCASRHRAIRALASQVCLFGPLLFLVVFMLVLCGVGVAQKPTVSFHLLKSRRCPTSPLTTVGVVGFPQSPPNVVQTPQYTTDWCRIGPPCFYQLIQTSQPLSSFVEFHALTQITLFVLPWSLLLAPPALGAASSSSWAHQVMTFSAMSVQSCDNRGRACSCPHPPPEPI